MSTALIIVIVGIAVPILYIIVKYNGFISLRNQVKNAWKQIDVQLKRRHDLIPNLIASAKGYMKFEQDTLEKVIKARNAAISATTVAEAAEKENILTQAMGRFLALTENYPQLKSDSHVRQLMEELTSTENKISFARQLYNDLVTSFNTAIQVFPANIIAGLFSFQAETLFEIAEF